MKMTDKITMRLKEFLETYPENMRYKVNTPNVLSLMEWSYEEARKDERAKIANKLKELRGKRLTLEHYDSVLWKDIVAICLELDIDLRRD